MRNKRGISLIVLIIAIIVVIILAAVVILTLSKNNPMESAKEASFKEDVRTFQDELAMTVSKQYTTAGGHRDEKISTSNFDEIKKYIPSFSEKYRNKFVIEDDELKYTNKLDDNEKEYAQNLNVKERRVLPKEYQQVEYIESTGTQCINTRYVPNIKTNVEYKVKVKKFIHYGPHLLSTSEYYYPFNRKLNNRVLIKIGGQETTLNINLEENKIYEYKYWDRKVYINGEEKATINIGNNNTSRSLYIFTYGGDPNNSLYNSNVEFYYCKIYNEDTIVRNLIPCYSTTKVTDVNGNECPIGTKGMYDTVEGKFYTNQGTGEFIAGPDV